MPKFFLRTMSEAKTASRRRTPAQETAAAVLELFELLVANARDTGENVEELGTWADVWKPRLEKVLRNGPSSTNVSTER